MENNKLNNEFVSYIKNFSNLDDQIKETEKILKELKSQKKQYEVGITHYMKNNKIEDQMISLPTSNIKIQTSKRTQAVNKPFVQQRLTQYFRNEDEAIKCTNYIYNNREVTYNQVLKRTKIKK